jgi:type IV secretion system protein VirD4
MFGLLSASYPWYTWWACVIVSLFVLGIYLAVLLGIIKGVIEVVRAAWRGVNLACQYVFGLPLSSGGTAHWASSREVRRAGLLTADGLPLASWKASTLCEPTGGHILVMGPPRSRKSTGIIMPCLERWPGSAVINDLRGELFDRTHTARERYGPVIRFDPGSPTSANLNMLDMVRWESHQAFGDVHRIVHHLLRPPDQQQSPTPFADAAIPLLVSIAFDRHAQGTASFPSIVAWMTEPTRALKEKLADLLASPNALVTSGARRLLDQSERLRAATWNAALAPLTIFEDPTIAAHTRHSDVTLEALLDGTEPLSLYLCMGFHEIARLGTFLGALVNALVAVVGSPERPPRHHVLLCLDEMANLGAMPELEKGVSYLQGSGTQLLAVFQNLPQVLETYGPYTPLLASISTQVHYRPHDVATAEHIAAHLGQTTTIARSWRSQYGLLSGVTDRSDSERARALLTPDEILRLADTDAIVLTAGTAPILARKLGTPPPTAAAKVRQTVVQHRVGAAITAACALVALALIPALAPVVQEPPRPQVAQRGAVPTPTGPLPAPPLDTAVEPPLRPDTTTPMPRTEPLLQEWRTPKPQPDKPWKLLTTNSAFSHMTTPYTQARHGSEDACRAALEQVYGPLLKQWENEIRLGVKGVKVSRTDGKYHWERLAAGQAVVNEAWCEKD